MLPNNNNYPSLDAMPFEVECPTDIIQGYFDALHFVMGSPDFEAYDGVSPSLSIAAVALCERFYRANEADIEEGDDNSEFGRYGISQLGHDLYMTTQGHGVGFWENDYPRSEGFDDWVTANADNRDSEYVGDDSLLYSISGDCDIDIEKLRAEFPQAFNK